MRFAQLELKAITALFLTGFEYEHVDAMGNPTCVVAGDVDRNDMFQKPMRGAMYIKYKKVGL